MIFRSLILFLLSLSAYSSEVVNLYGQKPITILGERLTPFWAQEYSGIDLVREEMKELKDLSKITTSIFDSGFEKTHINLEGNEIIDLSFNGRRRTIGHHGTSVANLINGEFPYGTTDQVRYTSLNRVVPSYRYTSIINALNETDNLPRVISNSMGWSDESIAKDASLADSKGVIWVLAGGYQSDDGDRSYEDKAPVINVASYGPSGLMSMSARDFKEIDVFSPGDLFQASINGKGEHTLFGESSGATPLVSGTIINLLSIVPELERVDIEVLLKRASLPNLNQYISMKSKAGLLNSYKMVTVVRNAKKSCEDISCIKSFIRNESNYKFKISKNDFTRIEDAFPNCSNSKREIFVNKSHALVELRKAVLLDSSNISLLELVSCIYKEEGFKKNAEFYDHLKLIQTNPQKRISDIEIKAIKSIRSNINDLSYLRYAEFYGERFKQSLLDVIQTSNDSYFFQMIYNSLD